MPAAPAATAIAYEDRPGPAELMKELSAVADYRTRFAQVFGGEITFTGVTRALGAFERDRGAFRTPTLRNVALTAPYMHNGALRTLHDVVAFYDVGGGTVPGRTNPAIRPLHLTEQERTALVAYLDSLTGGPPEHAATGGPTVIRGTDSSVPPCSANEPHLGWMTDSCRNRD